MVQGHPTGRVDRIRDPFARILWRWLRGVVGRARRSPPRLSSREAYRLWSQSYDHDPDNPVIALEEPLFDQLLADAPVTDKVVVDVGCGTGRHWNRLLALRPRLLHGVDDSPEMMARLRERHPEATLHLRTGNTLAELADGSVDLVVSTLMLGYAHDVAEELREWTRLLRPGGEIVFTDLHPEALRAGAKRTFTHLGVTFEIEHKVYTIEQLHGVFAALHLEILARRERRLDDSVRAIYERRNHLEGFRRGFGTPLVLGFHLRRAA